MKTVNTHSEPTLRTILVIKFTSHTCNSRIVYSSILLTHASYLAPQKLDKNVKKSVRATTHRFHNAHAHRPSTCAATYPWSVTSFTSVI